MNGKLFCEVEIGTVFWFGDNPGRRLVKLNRVHYTDGVWLRVCNPHVLVFQNGYKKLPSLFDKIAEI